MKNIKIIGKKDYETFIEKLAIDKNDVKKYTEEVTNDNYKKTWLNISQILNFFDNNIYFCVLSKMSNKIRNPYFHDEVSIMPFYILNLFEENDTYRESLRGHVDFSKQIQRIYNLRPLNLQKNIDQSHLHTKSIRIDLISSYTHTILAIEATKLLIKDYKKSFELACASLYLKESAQGHLIRILAICQFDYTLINFQKNLMAKESHNYLLNHMSINDRKDFIYLLHSFGSLLTLYSCGIYQRDTSLTLLIEQTIGKSTIKTASHYFHRPYHVYTRMREKRELLNFQEVCLNIQHVPAIHFLLHRPKSEMTRLLLKYHCSDFEDSLNLISSYNKIKKNLPMEKLIDRIMLIKENYDLYNNGKARNFTDVGCTQADLFCLNSLIAAYFIYQCKLISAYRLLDNVQIKESIKLGLFLKRLNKFLRFKEYDKILTIFHFDKEYINLSSGDVKDELSISTRNIINLFKNLIDLNDLEKNFIIWESLSESDSEKYKNAKVIKDNFRTMIKKGIPDSVLGKEMKSCIKEYGPLIEEIFSSASQFNEINKRKKYLFTNSYKEFKKKGIFDEVCSITYEPYNGVACDEVYVYCEDWSKYFKIKKEDFLIYNFMNFIFNFGKYKGETIENVLDRDKGYIEWLLTNTAILDFGMYHLLFCEGHRQAIEELQEQQAGSSIDLGGSLPSSLSFKYIDLYLDGNTLSKASRWTYEFRMLCLAKYLFKIESLGVIQEKEYESTTIESFEYSNHNEDNFYAFYDNQADYEQGWDVPSGLD